MVSSAKAKRARVKGLYRVSSGRDMVGAASSCCPHVK